MKKRKRKQELASDNIYCVVDGFMEQDKVYPQLNFISGMELSIKYTALSYLLYDLENYLEENSYYELLILLKELKKSAKKLLNESEARNDRAK